MWSDFVVAVDPISRDVADVIQRVEEVRTQYLRSVGPVEALDLGILVGFTWLNEAQFDLLFLAPVSERLTR